MAKVIATIDSWKIEEDGTMVHDGRPWYEIDGSRLGEDHWIQHMIAKNWVDARKFVRAYLYACQIAGLKQVTISTSKMF